MGNYTFRWEHPASEVYVTGTFDNWSKSVKLDQVGAIHEKLVELPLSTQKIFYKFVVDGEWQIDPSLQTAADEEGNTNNVLYAGDIASAHPTISSVAPGATTTDLAAQQPVHEDPLKDPSQVPGAFPETPALATGDDEKKDGLAAAAGVGGVAAVGAVALGSSAAKSSAAEDQTFSVNPIPASAGVGNPIQLAPGEPVPAPSTINSNTIASGVHDDPSLKSSALESEQTFGVAPIPASGGIGNPVHLQPGEPVPEPSTITANTLQSNVKLDQASYEKSDAGAPVLPPVLTPTGEAEAAGAPIFTGLGPQTTNIIPESSLPMGKDVPAPINEADFNPQTSSVAPTSTTAQLAGQVPLEPRGVPEVVSESQQEANVAPEASANPEAVAEKKQVEEELKSKVPEEQSSGNDSKAGIAAAVGGGIAAAGATAAATAAVLRQKTHETTGTDPVSFLPQSAQDTINKNIGVVPAGQTAASSAAPTTATDPARDVSAIVPPEVKESQKAAKSAPEASSNPIAVQEKSAVESELLSKVHETQQAGEPAPTTAAATSTTAPGGATSSSGAPQLADPTAGGFAPLSMEDKPAAKSSQLNAPASAAATTAAQTAAAHSAAGNTAAANTASQTQPVVTTGVDSGVAPIQSKKRNSFFGGNKSKSGSERPQTSGTIGTVATEASTKKKGFFSKIKEKLKA